MEDVDELEFAAGLDKVPVNENFRDAKGKSIEELLPDNGYMAFHYGGLNTVQNEQELKDILFNKLETFAPNVGIHYLGEKPPMVFMEHLYKEWMNSDDQISATLLTYGYFAEPLSEGYFLHIENVFSMNLADLELVNNKFDEMITELKLDGLSDYEKTKKLYQFVMDRMTYVSNDIISEHSPMGFIFHGEGVCQAYAISLHMLLEKAGIESRYIIGEVHPDYLLDGEDGGHAWNMVKMDGKWYHLDATFDDGSDEWEFFLLSDTGMSYTRSWEKQYYEQADEPYES